MKISKRTRLLVIACLTLGLAPFSPEPHIVGKIKWIFGGATGMQPMDWFDTILHGTPWVLLILSIASELVQKSKESDVDRRK